MADLDRELLTQYVAQAIGLAISVSGVPTDADSNIVTVTILNQDTNGTLWTGPAVHTGTGEYQVMLSVDQTSVVGNYQVNWIYSVAGIAREATSYYGVGGAQPAYDNLTPDMQAIVDSVVVRFADMFDSPSGGPNLQTWRQANWGRGRIAQMMSLAIDRINTAAQPYSQYTVDGVLGPVFPTSQWGALLRQAAYVECLKHLRRSYLEQPEYIGNSISRLDRRDYFDRWGVVLADEEALMRPQLDTFKIKAMGLGRPAILVSGGVYGRFSPVNMPGMAGRPRFYYASY